MSSSSHLRAAAFRAPDPNPFEESGPLPTSKSIPPEDALGRRRGRRVPAGANAGALLISDAERMYEQAVLRDVSPGGLSFWSDIPAGRFAPASIVRNVVVRRPGVEEIVVDGEVRYATTMGSGQTLCGLRVLHASVEGATAWRDYAYSLVYPDTAVGGSFNEEAWTVYEASGYFDLSGKDPQQFEELKQPSFAVNQRFDAATNLGFRVMWPARHAVASVSMIRAYQQTWLGHQMAKSKRVPLTRDESLQALRSLYRRAYEPLLGRPDCAYLLGYCEAKVRWMRAAHYDFAARHAPDGLSYVSPFRLLEADARVQAGRQDIAPVAVIAEADESERRLVATTIQRQHPRAFAEALDLTEDRIDLVGPCRAWHKVGFARSRCVLVAHVQGRAVAAAILETAERGTNFFHLLDSARLVRLTPVAVPTLETAFSQLLVEAARWYLVHDRERFVYFCDGYAAPHARDLPDLGDGFVSIISSQLLPDFLEHVAELTEPVAADHQGT